MTANHHYQISGIKRITWMIVQEWEKCDKRAEMYYCKVWKSKSGEKNLYVING
jgi:hypothetical protein